MKTLSPSQLTKWEPLTFQPFREHKYQNVKQVQLCVTLVSGAISIGTRKYKQFLSGIYESSAGLRNIVEMVVENSEYLMKYSCISKWLYKILK